MQTQSIAHGAADEAVAVLYRAHALRLTRLAYVMLGDRGLAEDIVQEAFAGPRRRRVPADTSKAVSYLRTSVLGSCGTVLRRLSAARALTLVDIGEGPVSVVAGAQAAALGGAEQRALMSAIRRLPARQREALVLPFCLDEHEAEIARLMRIRPGAVRPTAYRALAALGRLVASDAVHTDQGAGVQFGLAARARAAILATADEIRAEDVPAAPAWPSAEPARLGALAALGAFGGAVFGRD
ncbi:MAG: sigma factor-like helix-turn-helix DNA-binding protein, partial [Trebonia sp.]